MLEISSRYCCPKIGEYQNSKNMDWSGKSAFGALGSELLRFDSVKFRFRQTLAFAVNPLQPWFYPLIACIGRLHHQRVFFLVSACSPDGRLVPSRSQSYDGHFVLKGCVRGSILELFILAEGQRHPLLTPNLNDSLGNLQIDGAGQLGYHGLLPDRDEASCLSRTFPIHGLDCAARHGHKMRGVVLLPEVGELLWRRGPEE
ncbi:hypothetical protein PAPYR_11564 [Paratrimastix pyriformis]|uniref:Uncharacterized protein n=1 Tax=Paratrimastix pyriformis TaxID=342808 RepID=A0ABQ8U8B6_9EUKA|nr:hypothetical protein PAPYR_11564 [Paratrimastix pyriformis]